MTEDSPQIQQLKVRYRQSFPEKLAIIRKARSELLQENNITFAREELHKLAGSSGMYGYSELAANCRSAMEKLDTRDSLSSLEAIDAVIKQLDSKI
ncbi:MAG: Hpt domain-containing protein [Gammaproteobacteria bacterium]|nr:Hpt domain-containing protein [Gammaproteobacteria bacterium]